MNVVRTEIHIKIKELKLPCNDKRSFTKLKKIVTIRGLMHQLDLALPHFERVKTQKQYRSWLNK